MMGLLAELQIRTYHESQGKPIYIVGETVNLNVPGESSVEDEPKTRWVRRKTLDSL